MACVAPSCFSKFTIKYVTLHVDLLVHFLLADDIRQSSLETYQVFENDMIEFALKAEQGAVVTLDTTKKFLNKLARKLGSEDLPYLNRLQAAFKGMETQEIKVKKGESLTLSFTLLNNGSLAWPADAKLYMTVASQALAIEAGFATVGLVEPGQEKELMVKVRATKDYSGKFQGFWKLSTEEPVMPTLLPMIVDVQDSDKEEFEELSSLKS